jgi:magnesium transporter
MSQGTLNRSTRLQSTVGDKEALAATLAEQRPEDIADLLNRNKPGFNAEVLLALPEANAVAVLDQPQLRHGAAIVREMRVSVRKELLVLVSWETKTALKKLLPYPEDCAGAIMTTEVVSISSDWTVEHALAHVRAVEHARETPSTCSTRGTAPCSRQCRCGG